MRPGYVCVRTLLTASLVLVVGCSGASGGQDQNKGKEAGAGYQCPTTGTGNEAVVCIDASTQADSSTTTGADAGGDADDDATGGQ